MGLRDILQAVREYPAAHAELETARTELRQAQQALEQSQQDCESLWLTSNEQQEYMNFLRRPANGKGGDEHNDQLGRADFHCVLNQLCIVKMDPHQH